MLSVRPGLAQKRNIGVRFLSPIRSGQNDTNNFRTFAKGLLLIGLVSRINSTQFVRNTLINLRYKSIFAAYFTIPSPIYEGELMYQLPFL